ncbi:SHOCT domain-containing protein [Desulfosporosinus metallidurans]|uniref:SHOCT domain-containing protein n=1 Tax=Desulfosporosinus metallidurans TaxID=1888891 RepID=UPI003D023F10
MSERGNVFLEKQQNVEYLLSVHYLKKLREQGFITYEQYDEIDRLNRTSFLRGNGRKSA